MLTGEGCLPKLPRSAGRLVLLSEIEKAEAISEREDVTMTMTSTDRLSSKSEWRPSVRKWKGERCPTTRTAEATLQRYQFQRIASFGLEDSKFAIRLVDQDASHWIQSVYAFVINDEIVRIGSSKKSLGDRLKQWSNNVTAAFAGNYNATPQIEADLWREELQTFGDGQIWARKGTPFRTPLSEDLLSAYQDEERFLISRHKPRLNRGSHR